MYIIEIVEQYTITFNLRDIFVMMLPYDYTLARKIYWNQLSVWGDYPTMGIMPLRLGRIDFECYN